MRTVSGLQRDRVRYTILSGRQVDRPVLGDGFLERGGVVGRPVTCSAERADIDPRVDRGQIQDVGMDWHGQRAQRSCLIDILNRGHCADLLILEAMRKSLHFVYFSRSCDALSALAVNREHRNVSADEVLHVDFGAGAVLITDDYGGAGNVFHASVFHPEFVGVLRIDGYRRRNILELRPDQG